MLFRSDISGLHAGEIVVGEDGDVTGLAVNLAAGSVAVEEERTS